LQKDEAALSTRRDMPRPGIPLYNLRPEYTAPKNSRETKNGRVLVELISDKKIAAQVIIIDRTNAPGHL
jgi:hypothetical protein